MIRIQLFGCAILQSIDLRRDSIVVLDGIHILLNSTFPAVQIAFQSPQIVCAYILQQPSRRFIHTNRVGIGLCAA